MGGWRIEGGWLGSAQRMGSPNQDQRPPRIPVDLLVIHGISLPPGEFGGGAVADLFCNRLDPSAHPTFAGIADLRVSAHLLIRRDAALLQFVAFDRRAWHAGASSFAGRAGCNDYSIGIELEGTDDLPYEAIQYSRLARVCVLLMAQYPGLVPDRIVGHSDIAPGRKTDPGPAFDWGRLHAEVRSMEAM